MGQIAIIGQSIQIKGELTGNEDLTIDGTVEGNINLKENNLTIGPNGNIKADLNAKTVTITGEVQGNVTAEEKVEIRETGKLRGNIVAPRIVIADGAFVGTNSSLVAPLKVGEGAYIGAGSTITEDVPPHALALGRGRQVIKEGWALKRKKKGT